MLFNGKECFVVDDALITTEGVRDIVLDMMLAIVPLVWGAANTPDDPTPSVVGGTEATAGRGRNLAALNHTDLWAKGHTLHEDTRSPNCNRGRKPRNKK